METVSADFLDHNENGQCIYENKHGYYILNGLGNMIYLPQVSEEMNNFIKDYLLADKGYLNG